jgi:hypothetical protein
MDNEGLSDQITLTVIYVDEDLIELEAVVRASHWSGQACAYTVPQDIVESAGDLQAFAEGARSEAEFVAGADNGIGLVALRFYRVDRSGHIACHVRLETRELSANSRPEQICRLSIEVMAETWSLLQFARQLGNLARNQTGKATLRL